LQHPKICQINESTEIETIGLAEEDLLEGYEEAEVTQ